MQPRALAAAAAPRAFAQVGRLAASPFGGTDGRTTMTDEATGGTPQVAVLGGGVMGETLVSALLAAGWSPEQVEVTEASSRGPTSSRGGTASGPARRTRRRPARADVVLLAVKPNVVAAVLDEIVQALRGGELVVSVAAGVPLAAYEQRLGTGHAGRPRHAEHARGRRQGRQRDRRRHARDRGAPRARREDARRDRARGPRRRRRTSTRSPRSPAPDPRTRST